MKGVIGKIIVADGSENIAVNSVIAVLLEDGEDISAIDNISLSSDPAPTTATVMVMPADTPSAAALVANVNAAPANAAPANAAPANAAPANAADARIFASPLAKRIAAQKNIEIGAIKGSGPHGRIIKSDVDHAIVAGIGKNSAAVATTPMAAMPVAAPITDNPFEPEFDILKLNNMRKTIAKRLTMSKQTIPHFYLSVDVELDKLLAMRKDLNAKADGAYKISVNDLVIKATGISLRKVPAANASYAGDTIKLYKQADVAVAVAIDGGLITPVVRDAGNKGLAVISNEIKELAKKAREGKLMPEEYQGGTFSISNLGMFGIDNFQAVVNPPQACILAIGAGKERAIVKNGELAIATVMTATLSIDHRAVDGAIGAEFLKAFKCLIEDPLSMIL